MTRKTPVWYVALTNADGRRRVVEIASHDKQAAERQALINQFDVNDLSLIHI